MWLGQHGTKANWLKDEIEIVVQIKGKVRAKLMVAKESFTRRIARIALADEKVKAEIDGKEIVKVIAVPNKLVNIVVNKNKSFGA